MVIGTLTLNTSLYTVKFTDVMKADYPANIISGIIWAQCENVVNQVQMKEDNFKFRYARIKSNIYQYVHQLFYMF